MRRTTMVLLLGAAACGPATSGDLEEGAFVVRLGSDTTAVERFTLTGERLHGLSVSRTPRTQLLEVTLDFGADGGIERYESRVLRPAAGDPGSPDPVPPGSAPDPVIGAETLQRTVIEFGPDEAVVEITDAEGVRTSTVTATPDMVPFSLNHFSLMEFAIRRALAEDREQVDLLSGGPMPVEVRRVSGDSVVVETGALGSWRARIDTEGRILGMAAGALGRDVERVPGLDVAELSRRFAAEDARGEGMGPLSPRDTLRTTVGGAEIEVDYSRPSARGRGVFGGMVPYGAVWRTGADRATHFSTDRPLVLGGERLEAGTYTLFTIPDEDAWTLIVNRQTGQAGTDHDPEQDRLRLPLELNTDQNHTERFTIAVDSNADGGVLRFRWETIEARIPFTVGG